WRWGMRRSTRFSAVLVLATTMATTATSARTSATAIPVMVGIVVRSPVSHTPFDDDEPTGRRDLGGARRPRRGLCPQPCLPHRGHPGGPAAARRARPAGGRDRDRRRRLPSRLRHHAAAGG